MLQAQHLPWCQKGVLFPQRRFRKASVVEVAFLHCQPGVQTGKGTLRECQGQGTADQGLGYLFLRALTYSYENLMAELPMDLRLWDKKLKV